VGSAVELEDGRRGVVASSNPAQPLRPKIVLVRDKEGRTLNLQECDLADQGEAAIVRVISKDELGMDPGMALGLPV
jgi:hypothetical protein